MELDWHRIFFSDHPYSFFFEILLRTPIMFLGVVLVLRLTGKRGVQQLSIFEMVMIITLGSAAGDAMFYEDVGILHALAVFVIVLIAYRLIIFVIEKNPKAELLLEGEPVYIIREGALTLESIKGIEMGSDEFFGELRGRNVDHLGQVRIAILEDTGKISVFYYPDDEVKAGLPILPDEYNKKTTSLSKPGDYACARCGHVFSLPAGKDIPCEYCKSIEWVPPVSRKRIT